MSCTICQLIRRYLRLSVGNSGTAAKSGRDSLDGELEYLNDCGGDDNRKELAGKSMRYLVPKDNDQ
jgi:hypothetical protein